MYLGDPDPLVRGMDQDPDPSIVMQNSKSCKFESVSDRIDP
jgi:hypothetical protein